MWKPVGAGDAVYLFAATLHSVLGRAHAGGEGVTVEATPEPVGRLGRSACLMPELFAVARGQLDVWAGCRPDGADEHEDPSLVLTAELQARSRALEPIGDAVNGCSVALGECSPFLSPAASWRLLNALRTLETEFVRLRDAQRYLFERRLRGVRTGEPDLDPEFTIVLEKVVYAAHQGDEVSNTVAQAVRAIAAELLPYVAAESA
jgi:hypothetical protein